MHTSPIRTRGANPKLIALLISAAIAMAAAFAVPGCAADPPSRIDQYAEQLTVIRNGMIRAWETKAIDNATWTQFRQIDREAISLLQTARAAADAGQPVGPALYDAIERRIIEAARLKPPDPPASNRADLTTAALAMLAATIAEAIAAARRAGRDTLSAEERQRIRDQEAFSILAAERVDAQVTAEEAAKGTR